MKQKNPFSPLEFVNKQVREIPPSGIRRFFDIAATMEDVISLGVGEPDFVTPWHIRSEAVRSLEKGRTYYTANAGLMELRQEIARYQEKNIHVSYDPKTEIVVTVGASEALDGALRALVEPGDEVLIPEPSFVCYKPCTVLAGGIPVPIETKAENGFKLTPELLRNAITEKTKLLVLPYPNNPTGGIMTEEDLSLIVPIIKEANIMVISDEIYSELTYTGKHVSIATFDGMKERTVVINGFSKAFAMTGWRLGYACAHPDVLSAILKIHQYGIMSASTFSQYAAIEALKHGRADIERMKEEYNIRRKFLVDALNEMGMTCFNPYGAFYVFPSIQKFHMTSEEFCQKLLEEQRLAVVPGTAFGDSGEGYVRISYAYSKESIAKALKRLEAFAKDH
ncbi:MAG: aminotransferase class I/II-fold pyridoxal phosphate-dependent enzyme [Clostridia bacterium]|nr:aminotransferase class I/II-fold pyridoxal phosphate-dependent enzyme [Clostridia bacterium]MBQ7951464.1 aminotransferase class I/II-fold pyridoxal phosphate-dependent enzyme [Clostridia bacterium]